MAMMNPILQEWGQVLCLQPTDEFEVVQVIRVDIGGRVDLKGVVVLVGVLKQAVHWVQHLRTRFLMENKTKNPYCDTKNTSPIFPTKLDVNLSNVLFSRL